MKSFFLLLIGTLFLGNTFGQSSKVEWMDSSKVAKLEVGKFQYFNASAQTELHLEVKTNVFVDFAMVDMAKNIESVQLIIDSDTLR